MAIILDTADLQDDKLSSTHNYWVYNGLDCCVTHEVFGYLRPQLNNNTARVYDLERTLQAPAMDMMLRGIKVDRVVRARELADLKKKYEKLEAILDKYARAVWDAPLNIDSPAQMQKFFYGAMKIPEIKVQKKGIWKVSTDREALEKMQGYFYCQPIINVILALRDVGKKISTLETAIDYDGRIRTSYNVAGTETGRWSSSANAFGTGGNLQNITGSLRQIFTADKGMKMAYIDLEQAESRLVGLLAWLCTGQSTYLDACESGDLHSLVCRLVWPDLAWTGDLKHDKPNVAEQPFYRDYSYRDMAKRGGHGTNYYGKARTIARNLKIEEFVAVMFQTKYFKAFPEIQKWHEHTAKELREWGKLVTPMGRERHFFDRLWDEATLRKAIAFVPQSTIADMLNLGMYQVWRDVPEAQLLAQIHDAIIVQYPEELEDEILPRVVKALNVELEFTGPCGRTRKFSIPSEPKCGWNWGNYTTQEDVDKAAKKGKVIPLNLDGMKKYKGNDDRKRHESNVLSAIAA